MFNSLFKYYSSFLRKPSILYTLNVWLFTRIQIFNLFICNKLTYIIEALSSLKFNLINIQLKKFSFFTYYINFLVLYISLIFFFVII